MFKKKMNLSKFKLFYILVSKCHRSFGKAGLLVFFPLTEHVESSWHVNSMSMSSLMLCPDFEVVFSALMQSSCQSISVVYKIIMNKFFENDIR